MRLLPRILSALAAGLLSVAATSLPASANPFNEPWRDKNRAIVIDAYEHNALDWAKMVTDKRITAFIGKATDGDGEPWACNEPGISLEVCRLKFRRYFVAQELYQTRRSLAKALGLKWGSYHLARAGNPVAQADHYLNSAEPSDDEVMVLDIEGMGDKWMSLSDAEIFAKRIFAKTGRYPMLYVNGSVAKHIADNRAKYRLLSRLPLWYARFNYEIEGHFPKGNWDKYAIWQFSATPNCNTRRCPYRVPGTPTDIDVNIVDMTPDALRAAWPFDELLPEKPLPVQPLPHEPFVASAAPLPVLTAAYSAAENVKPPATPEPEAKIAAAPAVAAETNVALVPIPSEAPRDSNERPRTKFIAMGDIFGGWLKWDSKQRGHHDRHGTSEVLALLGFGTAEAATMAKPAPKATMMPKVFDAVPKTGSSADLVQSRETGRAGAVSSQITASTNPAATTRSGGPD
jgi:GH25 family lysozyme M1 (1,4-beta-N-acetylmuramidase)